MQDLTEDGKYGILSLLFEKTRNKKASLLLQPFAWAIENL